MNLLLFSTDITTEKKVALLKPLFSKTKTISRWSVDTEDIDNVLRIEANESLDESDVINLLLDSGYNCEILAD